MKTLIFIFIACFLSSFLHATIINVPADQPTIQSGINAATNCDTVLVQPGTYVENINYYGKLITVASLFLTTQDTTYISSTIIDGNSSGSVVTFENGEDSTSVLCGFTITNGLGSVGPDYSGGGITCIISSNPSIINCTIIGNHADLHGGGIYCYDNSSPILQYVTLTDNSAIHSGGGVFCQNYSSPILQNITISGNSITGTYGFGGGIYLSSGNSSTLQNVTISDNSITGTYGYGGGIFISSSSSTLQNVTISDNSITGTYGYGGGIYCDNNSIPDLNKVTITGNSTTLDGGGIYVACSSPTLQNVTIIGNTASDYGGGIYLGESSMSLINSILWNDSPEEVYFCEDYDPNTISIAYSDIQGGEAGIVTNSNGTVNWLTGNINADPLFVDPSVGDYHLQLTSPCIDTGDPASPLDPDCTIADMGACYFNQYDGPIWHISTDGSDIIGTGCEQYPFATIQHGINISSNTNTVLLQPGTYVENISFNGKVITVTSLFSTTQDTTYISSTIIDGNQNGSVAVFDNGENSSAVLAGLTITNGSTDFGGGISCTSNSSPSLENIIISDNSATGYGGGIYFNGSNSILQNVTISGNIASYGGGIYFYNNSNLDLNKVTITGNSATSYGGGIHCEYSSPNLQRVTITGNSATLDGGGIGCYNSNPILINSILWNNLPQEILISGFGSVIATYSDIQDGFTGTGNIDSDPLFVDPDNGDYHLQPASPCIDSGDPVSPLDPDGTRADMGAYFFPHYINADFTADTTNGYLPLTVNFNDLSTQGTGVIDEWYWEFGDGNNSSLQDPSNEYLLPGEYTVSLIVTDVNDSTDTETKAHYIYVYPPAYSGPVWHISTTGSDMFGNGSTQYPFATIQHGINNSTDTDTVFVQPGTYVENINFNGKLITLGSLFFTTQDTSYISSAIIDGNSSGSVVTFENGEDPTAVLCGFTIINGLATHGGGIYCYSSNPSLENLIISGNSTLGSYPEGNGGGISCTSNSSPVLENIKIIGNSAVYLGGGIYFDESSSPNLQNVTITGNSALSGSGIYCNNYSSPSLENITITCNFSTWYGGGICCSYYSSPNLQNVTITGNIASFGGGICCEYSSPNLQNVTITDNSATDSGGGIYCVDSSLILINSILWNDSPLEIFISSGSVTATYSDIQGGWTGTGNIDSDPFFVYSGNSNYYLLYNSPCIDTGDPSSPLDPDGSRADMGAYYFDKSIGFSSITAVTDVPNDQGRSVIVTWQRSFWDQAFSTVPIVYYGLWEMYPFELDRGYTITDDINKAIEEQDTYFQREDTTWVFIANVPAMQWEEYSAHAVTYIDSTITGDYLSYFFVSAHTPSPWLYFSSSVDSGYSVDNIAPNETRVYIAQNESNIGLNWDEVEYGTFQGNSYPEINGIWYKIYTGDSPDFVCDEVHLIDTVTNLNYDYPLTAEEKKFFKIVVSDQPEAGRINNRSKNLEEPSDGFHKVK